MIWVRFFREIFKLPRVNGKSADPPAQYRQFAIKRGKLNMDVVP